VRDYMELPCIDYLFECFKLMPNGDLIWKTRPLHHFKNPAVMNMWNAKNQRKKAGRLNKKKYLQVGIAGIRYMNQRIVYAMSIGKVPVNMEVDHKNNIHDDNRPSNLRLANRSQNQHNVLLRIDNTSSIKGVHKHAAGWEAAIQKNNISYSKLFKNKYDAQAWVELKRIELHEHFSNHGK
jgi:hypothetical protein